MKVKVKLKKIIESCYHECPYFGLEGGPSPTMVCNHPYFKNKDAYAGCIISHPDCDNGFPKKCPLIRKNWIVRLWKFLFKKKIRLYKEIEKADGGFVELLGNSTTKRFIDEYNKGK